MVEPKCILLKNYFRDTNMPVASCIEGGIMNYFACACIACTENIDGDSMPTSSNILCSFHLMLFTLHRQIFSKFEKSPDEKS